MLPRARTHGLVALAALFPLAGCGADAEGTPTGHNLLLVVVDSLRADRLGLYGHGRDTSPRLDALAAGGVRFDRAYVTAPWTQPSVASLLTGLHPTEHGVLMHGHVLSEELETLPERLHALGYRTAGVVSNKLLTEAYRFTQGFERFDHSQAQGHATVSTAGVTERALAFLEELAADPAPFFLFVHYFDPHYRYLDREEVDFAPPGAGRLDGSEGIHALRGMLDSMTPDEVAYLEACYDEEIRVMDAGFGRLLDRLDALGVREDTLVLFTADHGEEFLEHGWLGHTRTLFEELVRAPLVLAGPGVAHGLAVDELVSIVSIPETALELLGMARPEAPFPGGSFAELARGGPGRGAPRIYTEVDFEDRKFVMKNVHKRSVFDGRYKVVHDLETGSVQLFDLRDDPEERSDVAARHAAELERLVAELDAHGERTLAAGVTPSARELSPEDLEELQRLGYAGADADSAPGDAPDDPAGDDE